MASSNAVDLETSDIVLMTDDLGKLAYIVNLSHETLVVVEQEYHFLHLD